MSPPAGTIDLGELPQGEQPELAPAWPARRKLARWRGALSWRPWATAAMTALVLVMATAAAARPQPALVLQFTAQVANHNVTFDEQHLYLFDRQQSAGQVAVVAYRWDGTIHWRTELPGTEHGWLQTSDGALLVTTVPNGQEGPWPVDQTIRLDPDTGEQLWTVDGSPVGATEDLLMLGRTSLDEGGYEDAGEVIQPPTELVAVDPATSRTMWSIEAAQWDHVWPQSPNLVILDAEGGLASYDLGTGELLATAPTVAPADPAESPYWTLRTFGSHVLVMDQTDGRWVVDAYEATTLQLLWSLTGDASGEDGNPVWAFPCGELVCLSAPQQPLRAVDPDTGEVVWTADWAAAGAGESFYGIQYPGAAGQALLTRTSMRIDDRASWLVEIETGRPILDLGQWTSPGPFETNSGNDTSILTRGGENGTWVGRLRPDLSGIDVLGRIDTITTDERRAGYCVADAGHLVCLTSAITGDELSPVDLEVWRLPG
jgi:outer membrane protein assembly factor BamB